jgi:hypothetical protein
MEGDTRQDAAGPSSTEQVSVPQAADHLGTTVDAIRKRVQRDTIPHKKDPDGRVWILLDTGRPRQDNVQDSAGHRQDALANAKDETIADLRARVEFLERELERRGDEANTLHRIVAGLTQANTTLAARMPELETPQGTSEDAETVEEAPQPQPATASPQKTAAQRQQGGGLRGLRRRLLGW